MTKKLEIEQTEIESPYELPEGWKWESLEKLCSIPITDGTHQTPTYSDSESGISFISSKDVTKEFIDWSNIKYITKELHSELYKRVAPQIDDILLAKNGTTGVAAIVDTDKIFDIYVTLALVRPNKEKVLPRYLLQVINSPVCKNQFDEHLTGIGVPNLHLRDIKITKIPLPPTLAEQKRIVSRIETLFAKLDEAEEKTRAVLDGFETRKAAILHKAFSGQLRIDNEELTIEDWEDTTIGECLFPMTTKIPTGTTFRYIDIDAIDNKIQKVKTPKVLKVSEAPSRASRELKENDVLFSMVRPYLKNIAFIDKSLCDCIASTGFYVCRCKEKLSPLYLYNFLCSKDAIDYLMQFMKGDNSPSIRKDDLLSMPIKLPPLNYQLSIVNFLDTVLEKESRAKEAAQTVLDQIALLKKSILARAFRGEL